jgi:dipeptidase E
MEKRHIVAMGGGGFSMEPENPLLDDFVLELARRARRIRGRKVRVAFVPTASGDNDSYLHHFYRAFRPARAEATDLALFDRDIRDLRGFVLAQDVIYVGGGNTADLLAVWRVHGLDRVMREAWRRGVILAGISAGAMCWFQAGVTDSFAGVFHPLHGGLGFLRGAMSPHYDAERQRRPTLHRLLRRGFPPTLALDDGAAAHFTGTRLKEVVSSRPKARAFRVALKAGRLVEEPLAIRYLGPRVSMKRSAPVAS